MNREGPSGVCVVGGGGHAKVCADILFELGYTVAGIVDVHPPDSSTALPYLGDDVWLTEQLRKGSMEVLVAVGSNEQRGRLQAHFEAAGAELVTAVSPAAVLSPSVRIGPGCVVMPGAVINADTHLGRGVIVNTSASIDHDGHIGDWVHVGPGAHLAGNVQVAEGAFLGVGVSVVPGRSIGRWSTVGAGAAVVQDVPDGATDVGVPNRTIK